MTVDVEEHFQVSAFEKHISREQWPQHQSRVEANCERLLELFDEYETKATFFVLGWIASRHPLLMRRIAEAGHEIASHGYAHVRVSQQEPDEFLADVTRTKRILEDIAGVGVKGYRAASFSIGGEHMWALERLQEAGYLYSSSIYPVKHDLYGMPEAPRFAFYHNERAVLEVPISTVTLLGRNVPCGGGGYFRLFPYWFSRWALRRVNAREGQRCVFYFHPWEIDPEQPRVPGLGFKTRFRHYISLGRMERRLRRLLSEFKWQRMDELYEAP